MKLTILVPTYRRSKDLARCLEALKRQTVLADEILLVVRDTDDETHNFLANFSPEGLPIRIIDVHRSGVIAALNAGLKVVQGDIVSITDDDAAPHIDWVERIKAHFIQDSKLAGVGGRDWMYWQGDLYDASHYPGASNTIGKFQWVGRLIGNHHLGEGIAREVDILKGVNMSYRSQALGNFLLDERLRGTGAQVDYEVDMCLTLKSQGWKILYDPMVAVDHFLAPRFDEDQRNQFNHVAQENMAHNETLVVLKHLPTLRKLFFLLWAVLIGTRRVPGLIQILRFFPQQRWTSVQRCAVSLKGRVLGFSTWYLVSKRIPSKP
jgi:glycosyltransferase involved in cell wall biosynthesis